MEVYLARQPIFDKEQSIIGYELLYRRSMNNYYEGIDDNQATADLINNAFLVMQLHDLTGGKKAFINFSKDMLVSEIPLVLPKKNIVVEVLESVEPTEEVMDALKHLKSKGYTIALDDFAFSDTAIPFFEFADIVKVEFSVVDEDMQQHFINNYKGKVKFLAEKVETREEYLKACSMGYDFFQGYFFSRPVMEKRKEIATIPSTLLRLMKELNKNDPDLGTMAEIIESDVGLTYKLLKLAGSVYYGSRQAVYNIRLALVKMGLNEIGKWVYLLLLKNVKNAENGELITNCLIRAKFMELVAANIGAEEKRNDYFLAGLFSSIDVLLDRTMEEAICELPISADIKDALLMGGNSIGQALNLVLSYELGDWDKVDSLRIAPGMRSENLMPLYVESLQWIVNQNV